MNTPTKQNPPEGWEWVRLQDIVKPNKPIVYGIVQAGAHIEEGVPYIKTADLSNWNPNMLSRTSHEIAAKYSRSKCSPGDIVIGLRGELPSTLIVPEELEDVNLTQGTARISVKEDFVNRFIEYSLYSSIVARRINAVSKGSTFKEISLTDLRKIEVLVPREKNEQRKIAEILSTWDEAIELTQKLIDQLKLRKKGLMQQLLTGKKRLPGFEGEWKMSRLTDLVKVKKGKALSSKDLNPGDYPVIAGGKTSPYSHDSYTDSNCITVSASGAYAGYIAHHVGHIWASDCSVLTPKEGHAEIKFVFHLLKHYQQKIYSLQSGGAQPHVYPKDLEALKFAVPSAKEQRAISEILDEVDNGITLQQDKVVLLELQKKGLMQQLLTGKTRVPLSDAS